MIRIADLRDSEKIVEVVDIYKDSFEKKAGDEIKIVENDFIIYNEVNKKIVSAIGGSYLYEGENATISLSCLCTSKDKRGRGYAKNIMNYISKLAAIDNKMIILYAEPHMVHFYEKLGFKAIEGYNTDKFELMVK